MHQSLVKFSEPEASDRTPFLADFATATPELKFSIHTGQLMFQITGAFAEFERAMIRERVKLGLKRAVAQGKHLDRPSLSIELERKAQRELRKGSGILKVAKMVRLGTGTVHRIKREMA